MKLGVFNAILLGGTVAEFNIDDRPDLDFVKFCTKKKSPPVSSGVVPDGYLCRAVRCKNYHKHKSNVKVINGKLSPAIECLPDDQLGCSTAWSFTYSLGKTIVNYPNVVLPKKVKVTCPYSGASESIKCNAIKPKVNPKLTFQWAAETTIPCPAKSESVWAEWSEWNDCTSNTCERTAVTRERKCWGGPNSPPKACKGEMSGPSSESNHCWPKVCNKCHADMGLNKFDFIGKSPVTKRIPWLNADKILLDGWIEKGKKIANMLCMDQENPSGPKGKACKCDNKGCYFSDAPLCKHNGYGSDYHWAPGAANEWTLIDFAPDESPDTIVNEDFTITYTGAEKDPRFADRVAWWENGPSICRVMENALMPGFERPIMRGDNGGISWDNWNVLECDMQIENYPGFPSISTSALGSQSYEVLRSSNTEWKRASQADFDKMVIVGNFNNGESFDPEQVYGLCRLSSCTKSNGTPCSSSATNQNTKLFAENAQFHPGVVTRSNGEFECSSILGAGRNVNEKNDLTAFDILVVQ